MSLEQDTHQEPAKLRRTGAELLELLHFSPTELIAKKDPIMQYEGVEVSAANPQVVAIIDDAIFVLEKAIPIPYWDEVSDLLQPQRKALQPIYDALPENQKPIYEKLIILRWLELCEEATQAVLEAYDKIPVWDEVSDDQLVELKTLANKYQDIADFFHSMLRFSSEGGDFILKNIFHDMRGWPSKLRSCICVFLDSRDKGERAAAYVKKNFQMAYAIKTNVRTYLQILKAQKLFLGEREDPELLDISDIESILKGLCSRFDYSLNICESESDIVSEAGSKTINLLIPQYAVGKREFQTAPISLAIYQAVKNAIKLGGTSGTVITVCVSYSEEEAATKIQIADKAVGVSYDDLKAKISEDAKRRSPSSRTLLDEMILNPELQRHIPPVFLEYALFERGRSFQHGTGLGLNMLMHVTRANDGYPEITNAIDGGAAVTLTFPDNGGATGAKERSHKILRFDEAAKALSETDAGQRALAGEFFSQSQQAWVEIYEATEEELTAAHIKLRAATQLPSKLFPALEVAA